MKKTIRLNVNGRQHTISTEPETPLLYVLRNELLFNSPKYGCGAQQCGACMVLLDGRAQPSCMLPVSDAAQFAITTLEGLSTDHSHPHPVQQAFVDEQAAQCGYCINGMVMSAVSLLREITSPTDEEIRIHMQRCLCRCGSHARVIRAIKKASKSGI